MTADTPVSARLYTAFTLLLAAMAPVIVYSPVWATACLAVFVGIRTYLQWRNKGIPAQWVRVVLGLACFVLVYLNFQTLNGLEAATPLLLTMAGLKVLESENNRDLMILMLLSFFGLATALLHTQSIFIAVYIALLLPLLLAQLVELSQQSGTLPRVQLLKISATLLLQSLPFALFLFVLFPRIEGPLWGIPQPTSATSGIPDELNMGDISELSLSPVIAFRSQFLVGSPNKSDLYWRIKVLDDFDGRTWKLRATEPEAMLPQAMEYSGDQLIYQLTLESQGSRYLPALERADARALPRVQNEPMRLDRNSQLQTITPVDDRVRYQLTAWPNAVFEATLSERTRSALIELPDNSNPRARKWAQELYEAAGDKASFVEAVLNQFSTQPYFYTLKPPALGIHTIDEFLFRTKRGFCEHYATSFTFLMRAVGIPARVVIGYQGGEYNAASDYWIVRQMEAHAWTEIWLDGKGWLRVDPTYAVAPERVEQGLAASVPESDELPSIGFSSNRFTTALRLGWDSVENGWNQWILGYGPKQQREFLKRLLPALERLENMVLALTVLVTSATLLLVLWLSWQHRALPLSAVKQAYADYRRWLAKRGLVTRDSDTPSGIASTVEACWPEQGADAQVISAAYLSERYQARPTSGAVTIKLALKRMKRRRKKN